MSRLTDLRNKYVEMPQLDPLPYECICSCRGRYEASYVHLPGVMREQFAFMPRREFSQNEEDYR